MFLLLVSPQKYPETFRGSIHIFGPSPRLHGDQVGTGARISPYSPSLACPSLLASSL